MATLLVAHAGGHLQELYRLLPRLEGVDAERTWVTVDTPQARSLLDGERVVYVPTARRPHDALTTARNLRAAGSLLRGHRFSQVVSTGSSIALSFLPLARLWGVPCHYVESATRVDGPSLTGRILRLVPGVHLYAQSRRWLGGPWRFEGTVFDGFAAEDVADPRPVRRVVVTVGSSTFGFEALLARVARLVGPGTDVLWQTGSTDVRGFDLPARPFLSAAELADAMRRADVVIGHAGIGTALMALEAGHWPLLVPRRRARGEHVDDHQVEVGRELTRAGLALVREVDELEPDDLARAARRRVVDRPDAPRFRLARP